MKFDRRITNGLAWAGVLLVVGVPTADLLSAQFMGNPSALVAPEVAVVAPIPAPAGDRPAAALARPAPQVAVTAPAQAATKPATAVDSFLESGRPLPSYITGAPAAPAQVAATPPARTPIVTSPAPAPVVQTDPIEVASIPPQKIAPVPMPLSMRPRPVPVAAVRQPVFQQPVAQPPALVLPPQLTAAPTPPLVVRPPIEVTATDLDDWETGPLSDFLAQRQQQGSNNYGPAPQSDYDPNGFFLDQGPNPQRDRLVGREPDPYFLFAD